MDGSDAVPEEPASLEPSLRDAHAAAAALAAGALGVDAGRESEALQVTLRVTSYRPGAESIEAQEGTEESISRSLSKSDGRSGGEAARLLYGAHRDLSCITLVWQGGSPGLEVLDECDGWVRMDAAEDAVAVLAGVQGEEKVGFRAAPHRVATSKDAGGRTSVVAFCTLNVTE